MFFKKNDGKLFRAYLGVHKTSLAPKAAVQLVCSVFSARFFKILYGNLTIFENS